MQITLTADQLRVIRDFAEPIVLSVLVWLVKSWIKSLRERLNEIVTANVNRVKEELVLHIDLKFKEHENSAFERIASLEKAVNGIKP